MKKRIIKIICITTLLILIAICGEILRSRYALQVTHYKVTPGNDSLDNVAPEADDVLRIVHLTDTHDSIFGRNNKRLISKVTAEKPDLIFITGDLVNCHSKRGTLRANELIRQMTEIAPVYVSLGNHEYTMAEQTGIDFIEEFENAGATVLDFSYVDVTIKGRDYRIGGIYGYCAPLAHTFGSDRMKESEFLMDYQDTDACKLLLCHLPVWWVDSHSLYDWDVDVVFSGHDHGGQVRIPYVGGLWAPDQGWFPGEVCGLYPTDYDTWKRTREWYIWYTEKNGLDSSYYHAQNTYTPGYLVLSRGLGNANPIPRFNNVPEIVVADIIPPK